MSCDVNGNYFINFLYVVVFLFQTSFSQLCCYILCIVMIICVFLEEREHFIHRWEYRVCFYYWWLNNCDELMKKWCHKRRHAYYGMHDKRIEGKGCCNKVFKYQIELRHETAMKQVNPTVKLQCLNIMNKISRMRFPSYEVVRWVPCWSWYDICMALQSDKHYFY